MVFSLIFRITIVTISLLSFVQSANIFKTYRKENLEHRDLPFQLTGRQVSPIKQQKTWSRQDVNKENVEMFLKQSVKDVGLIESDEVKSFVTSTAEWAYDSRSYDTVWTVAEIRPGAQATVVYAVVGTKRSADGQLQVSFGGLYAKADVIAKRKIIHHHSKRKWRGKWKTIRWTTESEGDRGITPSEVSAIHNQLREIITSSPEFKNLPTGVSSAIEL